MAHETRERAEGWLALGVLTTPWGVRGELKVHLDAEPDYVERMKRVYLGDERKPVDLRGFFRRGRFYTFKLQGIDTFEQAEDLRGLAVSVPRAEAPSLPAGRFFVEDIIGLRVVTTGGRELGTVADVLLTGANDVYVVRGADGEILVPVIHDVVVSIDPVARLITIEPMPGLLPES